MRALGLRRGLLPVRSTASVAIVLFLLCLRTLYVSNVTEAGASSRFFRRRASSSAPLAQSPKVVLVTGAAGFIGHHVMMALQKEPGTTAIGVDNFNTYYDVRWKRYRASLSGGVVEGDVCDGNLIASLLDKHRVTHVVHMAAHAGVRYSLENPQAYVRDNVQCVVALMETLRGRDIPVLYASSSSVYGSNTAVPFSETHSVVDQTSVYAVTKVAGEMLAKAYWRLHRQRSIGMRFFTVYGPLGRPDMAAWAFTANVTRGRPIRVFNRGALSRDFTYITDVVAGILLCLARSGEAEHEVVNIGRGEPRQLMDFVRLIEEAAGRDAVVEFQGMAKGDMHTTFADITAIRRLGYTPRVTLKEGVARFVACAVAVASSPLGARESPWDVHRCREPACEASSYSSTWPLAAEELVDSPFLDRSGKEVTFETHDGGTWTGPADQSSRVSFAWSKAALHIRAIVTDDSHQHNCGEGLNFVWNGDALQVMLTTGARDDVLALLNIARYPESGRGSGGCDGGIHVQYEKTPSTVKTDDMGYRDVELNVDVLRRGLVTEYQIDVPVEYLGLGAGAKLQTGMEFGIAIAINDGDDGEPGQKGWGGIAPDAVVGKKEPEKAMRLLLRGGGGDEKGAEL